jgi:RNA polymerase sigma-70 factor (ECF subfamily)
MTPDADSDETADETLMARLAQRDESALRELHRRYAGLVFGIATRYVGTTSAEEVVQDVFVTLWQKHASFDPARGPLRPWLMQIARRRARNAHRDARVEMARHDDLTDELAAEDTPPDDAEWHAHRSAVIRAAVDALPDAQRRALSLAFFDELTHEQVARTLGTSLGTAKTRIRLGMKRLAPILLAALAVAVVVSILRRREEVASRDEEALKMVTASDVVSLRLGPTAAAPPDAHGNYRSRPGARIAVLTTSHLPAVSGEEVYIAWAHGTAGWRQLGAVTVETDGRSLLVVPLEGAAAYDELRVTRETGMPSREPRGPAVLQWRQAE